MSRKVEAKGGKGGNEWDNGAAHDNVAKIDVRGGREGVQFIKIDYVKAGQTTVGPINGVSGKGFTQTFEIDHLRDEYLVSVKGWYDNTSGVIQALQFKTNQKSSKVMGYDENGTNKFTLEAGGNKITGFHGSAEANLKSLGIYFAPLAPVKLEIKGGRGGGPWDHGIFTGVRKLSITFSLSGISHIMVDYDKDGKVETHQNGDVLGEDRVRRQQYEFVLYYPYEYITSVEGTCDQYRVRSLTFKTSKDRTSPTYGTKGSQSFVFESKGRALVGLHGRSGWAIDAIGAYFGPLPIPPPVEKLQGKGGNGGNSWDDGAFDGVRKIYVGQGDSGVASLKFEYEKNNQVVFGEEHGNKTQLGYEEFELEYPGEYLMAVEGYYEKIYGSESEVITMLKFQTNLRTSPPFGTDSGISFVLEKVGHKIVGFHGKASHELHQIGVTVAPITK